MRRYIKVTLWTLGALLALLIAAAVVAILLFDPNKYKAEIAAATYRATGRDLAIQGDVKLSIFPWLGVETGAMALSNPAGFGKEPFAKISAATIKVKLLPLFNKELKVDAVTLDGLYLHLIRSAAGQTNWNILPGSAENPAGTAAPATADAHGAIPTLSTFAIGGVRMSNATVIWEDQKNQARFELNKLSLHTGPISPNSPVTLELDTNIKSSAPALTAHLDIATEALYRFDTQRLYLQGLKLSAQTRMPMATADDAKLTLNSDADLDFAAGHYQINTLQVLASLRGAALPGKQLDASLSGNIVADLKNNRDNFSADALNLAVWNLKITGNIQGNNLLKAPRFNGVLAIAPVNIRELLGHMRNAAPNTADDKTLTEASAKLDFTASSTDAEITKLEAVLDQTRITGKAAITHFAHPAYRFQLALDNIDVDRYLPPATAKSAKPSNALAPAVGAGAAGLPLETLRALDADGDLAIGRLRIAKLAVSDLKVSANAKAGLIRGYPLTANLYGGTYRGDLRLDARGKTAQASIDVTLNGVEIGPLTRDLLDKDLVAGTGGITTKLSGTGLDPEQLKRTLHGNVGFSFQNGRVNDVNLLGLIQRDYLKLLRPLAIDSGKLEHTAFSKFAATAKVDAGLMATEDMMLDSAQLNVKGRGTVNLVSEVLALRLDALPTGQLAKQMGQYKDTVIPIRVEGTLGAPKFATDLGAVLTQTAKVRLEKEEQKLEDGLKNGDQAKVQQLMEKAIEKLQPKLKGLFK
jgi:AsmA protein